MRSRSMKFSNNSLYRTINKDSGFKRSVSKGNLIIDLLSIISQIKIIISNFSLIKINKITKNNIDKHKNIVN